MSSVSSSYFNLANGVYNNWINSYIGMSFSLALFSTSFDSFAVVWNGAVIESGMCLSVLENKYDSSLDFFIEAPCTNDWKTFLCLDVLELTFRETNVSRKSSSIFFLLWSSTWLNSLKPLSFLHHYRLQFLFESSLKRLNMSFWQKKLIQEKLLRKVIWSKFKPSILIKRCVWQSVKGRNNEYPVTLYNWVKLGC